MPTPPKKTTKSQASLPPRTNPYWMILILLAGIAVRFYHATAVALWHDESFSALLIKYPWHEMFYRIGLDVHPPLYYILLRFWNYIFGWGLLSLRGFSILFGVLTIYLGYLFVYKAFNNQKLAILAGLFLALNPFQIEYSVEARMYALGMFLVMLSSYLLLKALESNKTWTWVFYGLSVAAMFYTHYYLFFTVAAQGIYFLYWIIKHKNWTWKGWGAYALSVVLYLPWIPTLLVQITRVEGSYWIPAPDRWSVPETIWSMAFGGQGVDHITAIVATLVALVMIFYFFQKTKVESKWLVILSIVVPFLGALLLSFKQAIYLSRYFIFASLFFSILTAGVIYLFPKFTTRRVLGWIFAVLSLWLFLKNWNDLNLPKPGMDGAAAFINQTASPQDHVYVGSSFIYFTFKYYNHTNIHPELISDGPLATIPHFSGTALLNSEDLVLTDTIFNHPELKKNDTVFLLWTTGFGSSKPNVPGNWSVVTEKTYGDTPGYKGDIYVTEYHVN